MQWNLKMVFGANGEAGKEHAPVAKGQEQESDIAAIQLLRMVEKIVQEATQKNTSARIRDAMVCWCFISYCIMMHTCVLAH